MHKFDDYLYNKEYSWIEKKGINEFKYYSCIKVNALTKVETDNHTRWVLNTITSKKVVIANELVELIINYTLAIEELNEEITKEEKEDYEKSLLQAQKKLDTFFVKYKEHSNINLTYTLVTAYKKEKWYCQEEVDKPLLDALRRVSSKAIQPLFFEYKKSFKKTLDKNSFTLFSLLAEDFTPTEEDVSNLAGHYKYHKNLLNTLLFQQRFPIIKKYNKVFLKYQRGNPFYLTIKFNNGNTTENKVTLIRKLGLNIFNYSRDIKNTKVEHVDDNLYLAIKHHLGTYTSDHSYQTTYTLHELIDNLHNTEKLKIYVTYAIKYNNRSAYSYIFKTHPHIGFTKHEVSLYILEASKRLNKTLVAYLLSKYPYRKYENIIDKETGLNALEYAKNGNGNEAKNLVLLLQKHNFKEQVLKGINGSLSKFFFDMGHVINNIAYLIVINFQ